MGHRCGVACTGNVNVRIATARAFLWFDSVQLTGVIVARGVSGVGTTLVDTQAPCARAQRVRKGSTRALEQNSSDDRGRASSAMEGQSRAHSRKTWTIVLGAGLALLPVASKGAHVPAKIALLS